MPRAVLIDEFDLPTPKGGAPAGDSAHMGVTVPVTRRAALAISLGVLFTVLLVRAFYLQGVTGMEYRSRAEGNRTRSVLVAAPRGVIVDRDGSVIAANEPSFTLTLTPGDLPRDRAARGSVITRIAELAEMPFPELARLSEEIFPGSWRPIPLRTGLSHEEAMKLMIDAADLPAVAVAVDSTRAYPAAENTESIGHLIGYLGKQVATGEPERSVGRTGIEAGLEETLAGRPGMRRVEVDARGREIRTLSFDEAEPGDTVQLTVDLELQKRAEEIVRRHARAHGARRAAAIILDPRDGAVLALVSLPGYDPNLFSRHLDPKTYAALAANPDQPLFPRAVSGNYPSGSTIKPFLAAAALAEEVITRETTIISSGGIWYANRWFFPDWKKGGHGPTNVTKAIAESVNTFFYAIGGGYGPIAGLGPERIAAHLTAFGFGAPTRVALPGEAAGLIPTPDWKKKARGEEWYIGDTYHLAIGQGDILVTPLQLAVATGALTQDGAMYRPRLILDEARSRVGTAAIPPEHLQTVRAAMRATVTLGSAQSLATLPLAVAGKTGTAEWKDGRLPHAWFTGFAPYKNPEVVITVLVEEGGEGSAVAVPIAREILGWMHLTGRLAS